MTEWDKFIHAVKLHVVKETPIFVRTDVCIMTKASRLPGNENLILFLYYSILENCGDTQLLGSLTHTKQTFLGSSKKVPHC